MKSSELTPDQLKSNAFELVYKFKRTKDDEDLALNYINKAIQSGHFGRAALADLYDRAAGIYVSRIPKTKENYDKAVSLYESATNVKYLEQWYDHVFVILANLKLCPIVYGFDNSFIQHDFNAKELIQKVLNRAADPSNICKQLVDMAILCLKLGIDVPKALKDSIDIAIDTAIKYPYNNDRQAMSWNDKGKLFKYIEPKTEKSFLEAKAAFENSIQNNGKGCGAGWSSDESGSNRARLELAELLSNPQRFGFDIESSKGYSLEQAISDVLKNVLQGKLSLSSLMSIYINHNISTYIHSNELDLYYQRDESDFKILKLLYDEALKMGLSDLRADYYNAISYNILSTKNQENYESAIKSYVNIIEKAMKTNDLDVMADVVTSVVPLLLNPKSQGYPMECQKLGICQIAKQNLDSYVESNSKTKVAQIYKVLVKDFALVQENLDLVEDELLKFSEVSGLERKEIQESAKAIKNSINTIKVETIKGIKEGKIKEPPSQEEIMKDLVSKVQLLEAQNEFKDTIILQMMERLEKLELKYVEKEQKLYCVTEVVYENELLNHPELLKLSIKEFGISRVLDMSNSLSSELISEAIQQNNAELLLAGCISLDCSDII